MTDGGRAVDEVTPTAAVRPSSAANVDRALSGLISLDGPSHRHRRFVDDNRPWWKARPKPQYPRDWRWFVGGVGRTLITTGVLIFGFVAYQLWGTGIQYAAAQDQLGKEFDKILEAGTSTRPAPPPTAPAVTSPPSVAPGQSTPPPPAPTTTVDARPELPSYQLHDVIAKIEIERMGVNAFVVFGVRKVDIDEAVGHFPNTVLPGFLGNSALAAHRTSHGAEFGDIDKLQVGDEIVVTTPFGRFVYVVYPQRGGAPNFVVRPSDTWVLATSDPNIAVLTLSSCHPKWTTKQRIIVTAVLDPAKSDPAIDPKSFRPAAPVAVPPELPTTEDSTPTAPPATTADGSAATVPSAAVDTIGPSNGDGTAATADDEDTTAFEATWFSDKGAFPQILLWGLPLIAVSLGAWLLSRKTRNLIGAVLGIAPFVVALYFWYENVNRLLPPGF